MLLIWHLLENSLRATHVRYHITLLAVVSFRICTVDRIICFPCVFAWCVWIRCFEVWDLWEFRDTGIIIEIIFRLQFGWACTILINRNFCVRWRAEITCIWSDFKTMHFRACDIAVWILSGFWFWIGHCGSRTAHFFWMLFLLFHMKLMVTLIFGMRKI